MLGSFNQKSLELFQEAMSESMFSDFSEGEFYDFTTCIRPDGSAYGTGGKCRKGTEGTAKEKGVKGNPKDPVAGLREQERSRQAKQAAEQKTKNLADAKKEINSISDEIKNRGPHTKKELADLNEKMKYAANRARQIESGKTMTREQFQAGLRKMSAKDKDAPEVSSRRLSGTDRVTREVARTGGITPVAARPRTAQEEKSISERNKKSSEERTKRNKEIEAKNAVVGGMAEKMANKQGTGADRPNKENTVNNFVGEINRLRYNSRDKNIQGMINRGDHEGITRLAKARMSEQGGESKERIAQAVATERNKHRADLKEALAKAPKEEHARIKELASYGAKQEIARAKERAQQEENAMFSIGWNLRD